MQNLYPSSCNMRLLLGTLHFLLLSRPALCGLSLLGVKIGGAGSTGHSPVDSNSQQDVDASFSIDTSDPSLTKLYGKALRFDVRALEVASLDGILKLSDSHAQFSKGNSVWKTTVQDSTVSHYHNNKNLVFVDVNEADIARSKFRYAGEGTFADLWLADSEVLRSILVNLCRADRTINPLPVGVVDPVANAAAVKQCTADMSETQLSLGSIQDYSGKLLYAAAASLNEHSTALSQLQTVTANLTAISQLGNSGGSKEAEEKERLRTIMTQFEAVVDALRLEVTGKVKTLKGGFDELQQQWGAVDAKLEEMRSNVTAEWAGALFPVQVEVRQVVTGLRDLTSTLNSTVEVRLGELSEAQGRQLQDIAERLATFNGSYVLLSASLAQIEANSSAGLAALAAQLAEAQSRTSETLTNFSAAWDAVSRERWSAFEAQLQQLQVNSTVSQDQIRALSAALLDTQTAQNETASAIAEHQQQISNLTALIGVVQEEAGRVLNSTVSGLHEEIMREFSLSRRDEEIALATLNVTIVQQLQSLVDASEELRGTVDANMTLLEQRSAANLLEGLSDLRGLLANVSQNLSDQHQQLSASLDATTLQLRSEMANTSAVYYNLSAAAIAELTSNTSQVVARSNSILARAIGDVNNTMLGVNASLSTRLEDVHVALKTALEEGLAQAEERNVEAHRELAAVSAQALQRTEAALTQSIAAVNATALAGLLGVAQSLEKEMAVLAAQRMVDVRAAENATASAAAALLDQIRQVEVTAQIGHALLNTSIGELEAGLSTRINSTTLALTAALAMESSTLASTFHSNLTALSAQWTAALEGTAANLSAALQTKSDLLRYSVAGLNATLLALRADDLARLDARSLQLEASANASQREFATKIEGVFVDIAAISATTGAAVAAINASLAKTALELHRQLEVEQKAHESALVSVSSTLHTALSVAEGRTNTSLATVQQHLQTLNSSLAAEILRTAAELRAGNAATALAAQDALNNEVKRLHSVIEESARTVGAAANNSLVASTQALRHELNQTAVTLSQRMDAEAARLTTVRTGLETALQNESERSTAALSKMAQGAATNLSEHATLVAQRLAEQKAALAVVNGTLSNVQVEQAKAAAIATSELRTALAAVNVSTASALTALAARADGIEVEAASLKTATTAQISSVEQQLGQVEGRTNISLSMQWTKSLEALEGVRSQAQRNISAVQTALTASLAGAEEKWSAQLDKADSATRTAVEKLRADTSASIAKGATELSVAVAAVNASLGKEIQHREAADGALGRRLDGLAADLASYSNKTDQQLRQHTAELQLHSQALATQQTALASTIKNFTAQQVEQAAALTQRVEARVREAEVQQQLGAVAVAALRNETNRLHMSVDGAVQRLQANEIGTVTLRADVAHLTTQQAALQGVQNNITTVVLPPVFSRLGALERAVEDSNGEAVRGRTELVAKIEAFGQRIQQVESAVGSVEQSLQRLQRDVDTNNGATMVSITKLQEQQNAAAAQANMTSAAVRSLTSAAELSAAQALTTKEHSLELAEAKRRLDAQQQQIDSLVTAVQAARAASEASVAALRETVDAQAVRIRSLEETVQRQRSELNEAKEDNHRLLREGASNASVDELRKLLFELQGQMLGHSSKVLDLLLQPRSAVVVKDPCGTTVAEPSVSEKLETTVNPDVSA